MSPNLFSPSLSLHHFSAKNLFCSCHLRFTVSQNVAVFLVLYALPHLQHVMLFKHLLDVHKSGNTLDLKGQETTTFYS